MTITITIIIIIIIILISFQNCYINTEEQVEFLVKWWAGVGSTLETFCFFNSMASLDSDLQGLILLGGGFNQAANLVADLFSPFGLVEKPQCWSCPVSPTFATGVLFWRPCGYFCLLLLLQFGRQCNCSCSGFPNAFKNLQFPSTIVSQPHWTERFANYCTMR